MESEAEAHTSCSETDECETSTSYSSETATVSLLNRLKSPTASDLARKRKIPRNPPKGLKKGKGTVASEPQKVRPSTRVEEFPDQHLSVVSSKLFCMACREHLSLKKSVIAFHVKSGKHIAGVERLRSREKREQSIAEMLKKYDNDVHPVGENLPENERIYRIKVLTCFLKSGTPLNKLDCFRDIFEEGGYRLTSSKHLGELIPFVRRQQEEKLKDELEGKDVSIIFDGTTHICEALVIVVRYIDEQWHVQQRIIRLMLLAKSLSGEELARQLIVSLSTELNISGDRLIAAMHDRASVNSVAIRTLKILYPKLIDVGCFSHTLDLVGEKFHTPTLDNFIKIWIGMFARSTKTKLAWTSSTGLAVPTYCPTRWWSKWEVINQVHNTFGDIPPFLQNKDLPPSRLKLQEIINDPLKYCQLCIELAITVDAGEPLVKATYRLESDGPLVFSVYEEISNLRATIHNEHYPNVFAISRHLASKSNTSEADYSQMITYSKSCIQPGYDYFEKKFREDLAEPLSVFKCARIFDPVKVIDLKPSVSDVDDVRIFPFLNDDIIAQLKIELPKYLAAAEDVSPDVDKCGWWKRHEVQLPTWSNACHHILLIQPSSGAAERAFSILSNSFGEKQTKALQDYIETSVMIQYNES